MRGQGARFLSSKIAFPSKRTAVSLENRASEHLQRAGDHRHSLRGVLGSQEITIAPGSAVFFAETQCAQEASGVGKRIPNSHEPDIPDIIFSSIFEWHGEVPKVRVRPCWIEDVWLDSGRFAE